MRYWLFQILVPERKEQWRPDVSPFPAWQKMVNMQVAAQQYPIAPHPICSDDIVGYDITAPRNIKLLKQMRMGDWVVAAFTGLRFAGYGQLTTDFYQDGPALDPNGDDEDTCIYGFYERFGCDWSHIPFDMGPIDCHDIASPLPGKKREKDIWLHRGTCIKEIEKPVFDKLKAKLDRAGAKRP